MDRLLCMLGTCYSEHTNLHRPARMHGRIGPHQTCTRIIHVPRRNVFCEQIKFSAKRTTIITGRPLDILFLRFHFIHCLTIANKLICEFRGAIIQLALEPAHVSFPLTNQKQQLLIVQSRPITPAIPAAANHSKPNNAPACERNSQPSNPFLIPRRPALPKQSTHATQKQPKSLPDRSYINTTPLALLFIPN